MSDVIFPRSETDRILSEKLESVALEIKRRHREGEISNIAELELRRKALRAEIEKNLKPDQIEKTVFISFSGSGRLMYEKAVEVADEYGFEVRTGFDNSVRTSDSLTVAIMERIKSSEYFLGIWTNDFDSTSISGKDYRGNNIDVVHGTMPSVWMPFELGVAASNNKPFRLMMMEGTHKYYYEKPVGFQSHTMFNSIDFEKSVRFEMNHLHEKHMQRISR